MKKEIDDLIWNGYLEKFIREGFRPGPRALIPISLMLIISL